MQTEKTPRYIVLTEWLIQRHLAFTGKMCFTYRGLRQSYEYYRRKGEIMIDWHTIERTIRLLCQNGKIKRIRKGKTVIFCYQG